LLKDSITFTVVADVIRYLTTTNPLNDKFTTQWAYIGEIIIVNMSSFDAATGTTETRFDTVFRKKRPLIVFFIIHSNDDQFTQNLYQL